MTSRQEAIKSIFESLLGASGQPGQRVHKRIDKTASIKIHAACVFPHKGLMLEVGPIRNQWIPQDFHKPKIKGINILLKPIDKVPGSDMTLLLELQQSEAIDVFSVFVARVCEELDEITKPEIAVKTVIALIEKWKEFFAGGSDALSDERQTGLYGELYLLHYLSLSGIELGQLLKAWTGSKKTNQDYEFGLVAIEVKTTAAIDTSKINITNLRQLDDTGLDYLLVARISLDARQGTEHTLPCLIGALRREIQETAPEASLSFEEKLLASAYQDKHEEQYKYRSYTERDMAFFKVEKDFPRLTKHNLPDGVIKASYEISSEACRDYIIEKDNVLDIVRKYCD